MIRPKTAQRLGELRGRSYLPGALKRAILKFWKPETAWLAIEHCPPDAESTEHRFRAVLYQQECSYSGPRLKIQDVFEALTTQEQVRKFFPEETL